MELSPRYPSTPPSAPWPPPGPPPLPPAAGPFPPAASPPPGQPPPVPPPRSRPGRIRTAIAVAGVSAVAVAGGTAGGWVAGRTSGHDARPAAAVQRVSDTFSGPSLDVASVVAKLRPSVVSITAQLAGRPSYYGFGGQGGGQAAGTGVIVSASGEVVTNAHVVEGADSLQVTLADGRTYAADVVGSAPDHDLALLHLRGAHDLTPATLGSSSSLQVGDDVVAMGNALDLEGAPTVTRGIVSALGRTIGTDESSRLTGMIQTDAAISSGNSGGPLVDAQGRVVGIDTAVATSSGSVSAQNIGFAIPVDEVRSLLPALRSGG